MGDISRVLAGYAPIAGVCPESGNPVEFLLCVEFARQVQRHQPYWKFKAIGALSKILSNPLRVYKGLSREGFDDGYCYFGRPDSYHRSPTIETGFPTGYLLGVSVHWDTRGFVILDWEKRRVDADGNPIGADKDFGGPKCIPI